MWLYGLGLLGVNLLVALYFIAGAWNRARLARRRDAVRAEALARPTPPDRF